MHGRRTWPGTFRRGRCSASSWAFTFLRGCCRQACPECWTLSRIPVRGGGGPRAEPEERLAIREPGLPMDDAPPPGMALQPGALHRHPEELRGYLLDGPYAIPIPGPRRAPPRGSSDLREPPSFSPGSPAGTSACEGRRALVPGPGPQSRGHHPAGARRRTPAPVHALVAGVPVQGEPTPVTWNQLQQAARTMDEAEERHPGREPQPVVGTVGPRSAACPARRQVHAGGAPKRSAVCCTWWAW